MAQLWQNIGTVLLLNGKSVHAIMTMLKTTPTTENKQIGTLRRLFFCLDSAVNSIRVLRVLFLFSVRSKKEVYF